MCRQEHTRFAQAVRYSPDGALFASAGFDGKIYLYDGATSELKGEVLYYIFYIKTSFSIFNTEIIVNCQHK